MNTLRLLRNLGLGVGASAAALAVVVATRPLHFHVERSIVVDAPPEAAFARVNDLHAWTSWSPYERLDPDAKRAFEGPASGVGASYAWSGNDAIGEGRTTIVSSAAPSRVDMSLELVRPFNCTNTASFTFARTPEGTKVTWAMDGESSFAGKALSLVVDVDHMVGADFERGLAMLKNEAESASVAAAK